MSSLEDIDQSLEPEMDVVMAKTPFVNGRDNLFDLMSEAIADTYGHDEDEPDDSLEEDLLDSAEEVSESFGEVYAGLYDVFDHDLNRTADEIAGVWTEDLHERQHFFNGLKGRRSFWISPQRQIRRTVSGITVAEDGDPERIAHALRYGHLEGLRKDIRGIVRYMQTREHHEQVMADMRRDAGRFALQASAATLGTGIAILLDRRFRR